jgi:RNA polymerase sigma factor (sigma-70 family)
MDWDDFHVEPAALGNSESGPDFREFFETEYRRLAKALFLVAGDPLEADELAQEALVRVFERWDRVRVMDSPAGYLYRTALNLNRSRLRRLASRVRHPLSVSPEPDPLAGVEARDEVRRYLAALPRGQREAVVLIEWLGMGAEQAGAILGIDASTVRVQFSRARRALRTMAGTRDE